MPPTQAHDRFEQVGVVLKTGYTSTAHAIELITRNCLGFTQEPLAGKTEGKTEGIWSAKTLIESSSSYTNAWQSIKLSGSAW